MRDGKGEDVPEGVAWTDYPKSIGFLAGKLVPRGLSKVPRSLGRLSRSEYAGK